MNPNIEKTCQQIEEAGAEGIAAVCPEAGILLDAVHPAFLASSPMAVLVTAAFLFGMTCAGIEGEPVEAEKEGYLISFEDRLQLFNAQARVIYRDAMKFRIQFDATEQPRRH